MEAIELVKMEYGSSHNFITPHIISYGWIVKDKMAYELSQGYGIKGERIYGLSIVEWNGTALRRNDLSDVFYSRDGIKQYIKQLKSKKVI